MSDGTGVGDRMREIRKRRGMTQRDLARHAGVSVSLVRKVEQGDHGRVGAVALRKLAVALDVPVTALLRPAASKSRPGQRRSGSRSPQRSASRQPTRAASRTAVASALPSATRLYHANRYDDLAALLPGLVRDAAPNRPRCGRGCPARGRR